MCETILWQSLKIETKLLTTATLSVSGSSSNQINRCGRHGDRGHQRQGRRPHDQLISKKRSRLVTTDWGEHFISGSFSFLSLLKNQKDMVALRAQNCKWRKTKHKQLQRKCSLVWQHKTPLGDNKPTQNYDSRISFQGTLKRDTHSWDSWLFVIHQLIVGQSAEMLVFLVSHVIIDPTGVLQLSSSSDWLSSLHCSQTVTSLSCPILFCRLFLLCLIYNNTTRNTHIRHSRHTLNTHRTCVMSSNRKSI